MRIHELKIKNKYFEDIDSGDKKFEYRKDDRGFKEGDILGLNEINENGDYTGRAMLVEVTYIFRGEDGIPLEDDYIIMSISKCYID